MGRFTFFSYSFLFYSRIFLTTNDKYELSRM